MLYFFTNQYFMLFLDVFFCCISRFLGKNYSCVLMGRFLIVSGLFSLGRVLQSMKISMTQWVHGINLWKHRITEKTHNLSNIHFPRANYHLTKNMIKTTWKCFNQVPIQRKKNHSKLLFSTFRSKKEYEERYLTCVKWKICL